MSQVDAGISRASTRYVEPALTLLRRCSFQLDDIFEIYDFLDAFRRRKRCTQAFHFVATRHMATVLSSSLVKTQNISFQARFSFCVTNEFPSADDVYRYIASGWPGFRKLADY